MSLRDDMDVRVTETSEPHTVLTVIFNGKCDYIPSLPKSRSLLVTLDGPQLNSGFATGARERRR